jgi:putative PIN family toxin of toxin-antitoxin system
MSQNARTVIDTNVVVSGLIFPGTIPAKAILKAQKGTVLASEAMRSEVLEVFSRARFDRYVSREYRQQLAASFILATEDVLVVNPIRVCRDPRDDKFLEAAAHGRADAIVTGDLDLLALDPFYGIRILTPGAYLDASDA